MNRRDFLWIFLTALLCIGWLYNGYNKGLSHNPKIEFVQAMRNTQAYAQGFKSSGYNFFGCEVKEMNYDKKEVLLNKCTFKYLLDRDIKMIKKICGDKPCLTD